MLVYLSSCNGDCSFWQTSEKPKIDLVIEMEKLEEVHPVLEGIIMDAAINAIDSLLTYVSLKELRTINSVINNHCILFVLS